VDANTIALIGKIWINIVPMLWAIIVTRVAIYPIMTTYWRIRGEIDIAKHRIDLDTAIGGEK